MDRRYKRNHVLRTTGDIQSGIYTGDLLLKGVVIHAFPPISNNHRNGIQVMRHACAAYLRSEGHSDEYVIQHHCIKDGRPESKNPVEDWTIHELETKTKK